jgi:4-diphosphocytidyl-2-C-methyl-D-erythritol kinase
LSDDPLRRLAPVVRLAPAKLNLTLSVIGKRSDGFHALHSVMAPLAMADRLSLAPAGTTRDALHVSGFHPGPVDDNLVLRAIAAARSAIGEGPGRPATPALAVRLEKHIPVAGGLAGGSSDAAAALDGALEAWAAPDALDADRRAQIAARLGSDVPFFLSGGVALVEGRGERVTRLTGVRGHSPGVLLVTPAVPVSTRAVFTAFDALAGNHGSGATRVTSAHLAEELGAGLDAAALVVRAGILAVANDLLAAADVVAPGLAVFRRSIARQLGRPVGQSGSGPTCWALYPSLDAAVQGASDLRNAVAAGQLGEAARLGDGPPFIAATAIESGGHGDSHDA